MTVRRHVRLTVTGRVQGVGYRAWFERQARAGQLAGWVRNRADGSVEAVVAGSASGVQTLASSAWKGPSAARVDSVTIVDMDSPEPDGFRMLPTD